MLKIINQVRLLIDNLCKAKNVNLPDNFNELNNYQLSTSYINNQVIIIVIAYFFFQNLSIFNNKIRIMIQDM